MRFWRAAKSQDARAKALPAPPRRGMVRWYDPGQLLSTGIEVLISRAMGQRFDYRLMEEGRGSQGLFDYCHWEGRELYFDYLADTGDGWNSTYAVASLVAQPELTVGGQKLPRGAFLILGGDEVYPMASQPNYRERLVAPFQTAWPRGLDVPQRLHPASPGAEPAEADMFAIPGNHDWYDGLVSFSRLFAQGRSIGEWQTFQRRSYFAIQLPCCWWLWGVDVQLESDIDLGQLEYFRWVAKEYLRPRDRVILASAEPDWIYGDIKDPMRESNLGYLEDKIIEQCDATVYVWVAGDLHHYRRHERVDDRNFQRLTSGGGGAYLSSTHRSVFGPATNVARRTVEVGNVRYEQQAGFPSPATSWRLSLLNLFFLVKNWKFGVVTGLAYASLTWLRPDAPSHWWDFFSDPVRALWAGAVLLGASFFAFYSGKGKDGRLFRLIGGITHAAAHTAAALAVASLTATFVPSGLLAPFWRFGLNFVGGALVGPAVLGLYLMVGANLFGAYTDEAFSALRIQDYKHFLRFRINRDGSLDIFPIAIDRVPRNNEGRAQYRLIEGPIKVSPS